MTAPATYIDNLNLIQDNENVDATVANRPINELKNNTDWLKARLLLLSGSGGLIAENQACSTDCDVGMAVYRDAGDARFEPAQGTLSKKLVMGIVYSKDSASVASILVLGLAELDITGALETGQTLSASRYYLSATEAGKLTTVAPGEHAVAVLVADGAGLIVVNPFELLAGPQGPEGSAGADIGIFKQTATVSVTNTTAETTLLGSGVGSLTIAGEELVVGNVVRLKASGTITNDTDQTHRFKVKMGSTVILDSGAVLAGNPCSARQWRLEAEMYVRVVGASGSMIGSGVLTYSDDASQAISISLGGGSAVTLDLDDDKAVNLTTQWSAGGSGNGATCFQASVEVF